MSAPPPIFNFDTNPTGVGGPYEYGVPGAVHGIFKPPTEAGKPAVAAAKSGGRRCGRRWQRWRAAARIRGRGSGDHIQ